MKYYNAVQAAKAIGVSDKTIRNWIEEGKLHADRTPSNRLAIPESEVEKLKKEYSLFSHEEKENSSTEVLALSVKVLELELRCKGLEQRVVELEQSRAPERVIQSPLSTFTPYDTSPPQKRTTVPPISTPIDLPPGSMLFADFAEKHGIPRATFSHHIKVGIAGEKVEVVERPKPGRPEHTERWLTPELQEKSLAFWDKHGVKYTRADEGQSDANETAWYQPGEEG